MGGDRWEVSMMSAKLTRDTSIKKPSLPKKSHTVDVL